ncbi:unnamed protein product [Candida verbasci]|uniref:Amino acid permease/ SLC12A domain-containing protein n=1 Tax=Candida verbasci TaxID=1227364 RepID=A0A9W4TZN1_9ASCO|nr:unnamed protein product [Candida verbasci]
MDITKGNMRRDNENEIGISSSITTYSTNSTEEQEQPSNIFHNFIDSFKSFDYSTLPPIYDLQPTNTNDIYPSKSQNIHPSHPNFDYSNFTRLERDALITANSPLTKGLKTYHLTYISIAAVLGSGLFITSGSSLSHAGPCGILLVWLFISSIIFATMSSLSELATAFPVSGAFVTFPTLFIDKSIGFAIAWNYALQWLVTMPLQLIAGAMCVQYWRPDLHPAIFVTVFYVVIVWLNLFGVKRYGDIEVVLSLIKITAVIGFNILAIIVVAGGVPGQPYIGGRNWHPPFNSSEPFKNMCYIISNASFSFAGIELFALASVESATPKTSIEKSRKQIFYRILIFYILSIIMIGFLVSYKSPQLSRDSGFGIDINTSPFVIAIKNANIHALPSIMNAVVIITVLSVGNSSVYASTRVLCAIGSLKQGPSFLSFIDRNGRPMGCLIIQFLLGLLAYLVCIRGQSITVEIFEWLLSLSGLSALFTYLSVNICQIRFHQTLNYKARIPKEELLYVSPLWCSIYGIITILVILGLQFWAALFPPGEGKADAKSFFKIYLSLPVFIVSWIGHKIYDKVFNDIPLLKLWLSVDEIDVDSGRTQYDLEAIKQEIAERELEMKRKPWWYKVYNIFC